MFFPSFLFGQMVWKNFTEELMDDSARIIKNKIPNKINLFELHFNVLKKRRFR